MTTTSLRRGPGGRCAAAFHLGYADVHVRRVGDDVEDGRTLLRLRDQGFDVLLRGIRVDLVVHLDPVEPVAHVAVDAEDAVQVHPALERRRHGPELYLAVLRDGSDAGCQAPGEADEHHLDGCRADVLGGEDRRMIGIEFERRAWACSAPRPKNLSTAERVCVPRIQVLLALHLNWAASGAPVSASRASSSAWTLTPLLIFD